MNRLVVAGGLIVVAGLLAACEMYGKHNGPSQPNYPPGPVGQKPFIAHYERGPGAKWDATEYSPPNFIYGSYGELVAYDQFDRVGERVSTVPPLPLPPVTAWAAPSRAADQAENGAGPIQLWTPAPHIRRGPDGVDIIEIGNFPAASEAEQHNRPQRRLSRHRNRGRIGAGMRISSPAAFAYHRVLRGH